MLRWFLVNAFGIQKDDAGRVWHAGHVNDVLELDSDTIVVAADRAGVWQLSVQGDGRALSNNWDNPDVLSLAFGPAGSIFAASGEYGGKGALWVTDPGAADPLAAWQQIPIPDAARGLTRVVVLPAVSRIVIAAQRGLWYSPLPPADQPFTYQWTQVVNGFPNLGGDVWTEIAEAAGSAIVASVPGSGLFYGTWVQGDLRMQPAALPNGIDGGSIGRTSLCSCANDRNSVYAVCADGNSGDPSIRAVLSSGDGGQHWQILNTQVIGQPQGTTVPAMAGNQGWYNNCIAVSPNNSAVVALGWRTGPFISQDSGGNWRMYGDQADPNLHGDLHAVYFSPSGRSLYVGSDGGVVRADVVLDPQNGPSLQNFTSMYNQRLATLQFGGWPAREFWATIDANDQFAVGGLQDNGNVYCRWRDRSPWRQSGDSDGQLTLLTTPSELLFDNNSDHTHPTHAAWNGTQMVETGTVPLLNADGSFDANGITGLGSPRELFVDTVVNPALPSQYNSDFRIVAVAGVGTKLYGLFPDDRNPVPQHWEFLADIPLDAADFITAVGSYDGLLIFAGSDSGRIFLISPADGYQAEISPANLGRVTRLLLDVSQPPLMQGIGQSGNTIIRFFGSTDARQGVWGTLGPVTQAGDGIFDVAADWTEKPPRLFAVTDRQVFSSQDGRNWNDIGQGLPATPHCAGLRLTSGRLFLSTFGRSMWFAYPDPCQPLADSIDALVQEIQDLRDALAAGEIPAPPRTPEKIARVVAFIHRLQGNLRQLQLQLKRCRAQNP